MTPSVTIADWKAWESGTLRGFFTARLPSGLSLSELALHTRNGSWWIGFPARPILQDGVAQRDERGKIRYSPPLIAFANCQTRDRFTAAVLAALRQAQPEAFAEERTA
jgi:hypothetical protein